ncbi:hypothetical protein [Saccharospirillum impatiens]|uniref:hypothetical protein n=1 Tax=Saccharospirillum impatiens TaxID=169438 RepID=UPI0012FA2D0D|nr:hypothetical protein [Saccharospirillum impatiens]
MRPARPDRPLTAATPWGHRWMANPIDAARGTRRGGQGFSGGEASLRAGGRHGWRAAAQVGVALARLRDDTALDDVAL